MAFNDGLILIILILTLLQRSSHRFFIVLVFGLLFGAHSVLSSQLSDFNYYLYDGLAALLIVAFVSTFPKTNQFTDRIMCVCLAIILCDFIGWLYLYEAGYSELLYNSSFVLIHLFAIFAVLTGDNKSEPFFISRMRFLRLHNWHSSVAHKSLHKKA